MQSVVSLLEGTYLIHIPLSCAPIYINEKMLQFALCSGGCTYVRMWWFTVHAKWNSLLFWQTIGAL